MKVVPKPVTRRTRVVRPAPAMERPPERPVLIVDDNEDILATARVILERNGFRVATRVLAPEWVDLQELQPCVVFMDINLGRESGLNACASIKDNPRFAELPVILISGLDGERLADAATRCRADGFLTKPYSPDLLVKLAWHYGKQATDKRTPNRSLS